jgi:hypothetical protein
VDFLDPYGQKLNSPDSCYRTQVQNFIEIRSVLLVKVWTGGNTDTNTTAPLHNKIRSCKEHIKSAERVKLMRRSFVWGYDDTSKQNLAM